MTHLKTLRHNMNLSFWHWQLCVVFGTLLLLSLPLSESEICVCCNWVPFYFALIWDLFKRASSVCVKTSPILIPGAYLGSCEALTDCCYHFHAIYHFTYIPSCSKCSDSNCHCLLFISDVPKLQHFVPLTHFVSFVQVTTGFLTLRFVEKKKTKKKKKKSLTTFTSRIQRRPGIYVSV